MKKSTKKSVSTKKVTKSNGISNCAQAVKDAKLPTDPKAELTMPQAAKLLGVTQYAVYVAAKKLKLKDRTLATWKKNAKLVAA